MSYYPYIPYLEASQSIVRNLEDLPRADRELEDRNLRKSLLQMQMENQQMQLDDARRMRNAYEGLPAYLEENRPLLEPQTTNQTQAVPDYSRTVGGDEYAVPGERMETTSRTIPARQTRPGLMAEYFMSRGLPKESYQWQKEADLDADRKLERKTGVIKLVGEAMKSKNQSFIDSTLAIAREMAPDLPIKDIKVDEKTGVRQMTMTYPNGLTANMVVGDDGKVLSTHWQDAQKMDMVTGYYGPRGGVLYKTQTGMVEGVLGKDGQMMYYPVSGGFKSWSPDKPNQPSFISEAQRLLGPNSKEYKDLVTTGKMPWYMREEGGGAPPPPSGGGGGAGKVDLKNPAPKQPEKKAEPMSAMPDPKKNAGKTIRDTESGKRYKSNGKQWVEQ